MASEFDWTSAAKDALLCVSAGGPARLAEVFQDLAQTSGVEIRTKHNRAPMHLKSYEIDGRWLRTGAANFSASGLKRQDNDLIVIKSAEAAESKFRKCGSVVLAALAISIIAIAAAEARRGEMYGLRTSHCKRESCKHPSGTWVHPVHHRRL